MINITMHGIYFIITPSEMSSTCSVPFTCLSCILYLQSTLWLAWKLLEWILINTFPFVSGYIDCNYSVWADIAFLLFFNLICLSELVFNACFFNLFYLNTNFNFWGFFGLGFIVPSRFFDSYVFNFIKFLTFITKLT